MNFFSSKFIFLICLLLSPVAWGIDLMAVYYSSCERSVGVMLSANQHHIYILNTQGGVQKINRYEIIGLASYPLEYFPLEKFDTTKVKNPSVIPFYKIKTNYHSTISELVRGWPIKFSESSIAFLAMNGDEVIISRDSIWDIRSETPKGIIPFEFKKQHHYRLLHPTNLKDCPLEAFEKKSISVAPEEFISNAITIKKRIDNFSSEQDRLQQYIRQQKYYAIPQIYKNRTTLGFWVVTNSQHAKSENRTNNGTPIVENEYSTGPFGYQHIFYTGSTPNFSLMHEEAQTQTFYRLKADYFHASFFFDPNQILIKKYSWKSDELSAGTDRIAEETFIELGFDFKNISLGYYLTTYSRVAVKNQYDQFYQNNFHLTGFALKFQNYKYNAEILYFWGDSEIEVNWEYYDFTLATWRFNLSFDFLQRYKIYYSYINRHVKIENTADYDATTSVHALYLDYQINYKYLVKFMASLERLKSNTISKSYPKFGANFSLVF